MPAAQKRSEEIAEFLCSPDYFKPQDVKKLLQHDLEEQMNPGLYVVFKRALDVVGEATTTTVSRWI